VHFNFSLTRVKLPWHRVGPLRSLACQRGSSSTVQSADVAHLHAPEMSLLGPENLRMTLLHTVNREGAFLTPLPGCGRFILPVGRSYAHEINSIARHPRQVEESRGKLLDDKVSFVELRVVLYNFLEGSTWKLHKHVDVSIPVLAKHLLRDALAKHC
jgi:hypothetical protein